MKVRTSRIAIVSHILPPSPSGQATVLYWLLKDLNPEFYYFISREDYSEVQNENIGLNKLLTHYHTLVPPRQFSRFNRYGLKYLRDLVNGILAFLSRTKQIVAFAKMEGAELILACTGDLYDLPSAYLASKQLKIPFVPYIFDDFAFQWTGKQRLFSRLVEPIILRGSKDIIVPNEFMSEEYLKRYGLRSTIIRNLCPLPDLEELDKADKVFPEKSINVVYTGSVYHAHYDAFRNLIGAIEHLGRKDVKLHIFTAQPQSQLESEGICGNYVVYHQHICHSEVAGVLRQSDVLFLPLAFNSPIPEVIKTSAPGKMGEYLAVGRPIIAHAPEDSFVAWYFRKHNCGLVVDKPSPGLMVETLQKAIANNEENILVGKKARLKAEQDFALEITRRNFYELLNRNLEGRE
jgi:glycosyltransferase involved in cell wall biosynthesis